MFVSEKLFSNNSRDAHEKLRSCIVWYKTSWYFLSGYISDWEVTAESLKRTKEGYPESAITINLLTTPEEDFKVGPFNLGMSNLNDKSVYFLSRRPLRRNKFALREENSDVIHVAGEEIDARISRQWTALVLSNSFYNTLTGVYPSYLDVIDALNNNKTTALAFNRAFAIERVALKIGALKYRTTTIGEVNLFTNKIELYPAFSHMKERCSLIYGCPKVFVYPNQD